MLDPAGYMMGDRGSDGSRSCCTRGLGCRRSVVGNADCGITASETSTNSLCVISANCSQKTSTSSRTIKFLLGTLLLGTGLEKVLVFLSTEALLVVRNAVPLSGRVNHTGVLRYVSYNAFCFGLQLIRTTQ